MRLRPLCGLSHPNSRLGETPCRRATAETVIPGCLCEAVLRTLDQPELLLSTVAASTLTAGDDFNARRIVRHRRMPRRKPRPSWLRPVSGRIGGHSTDQRAQTLQAQSVTPQSATVHLSPRSTILLKCPGSTMW
jgi:hypothetical protein